MQENTLQERSERGKSLSRAREASEERDGRDGSLPPIPISELNMSGTPQSSLKAKHKKKKNEDM